MTTLPGCALLMGAILKAVTMPNPGLDEHDTWSYLDGSLFEHNVMAVLGDGIRDRGLRLAGRALR